MAGIDYVALASISQNLIEENGRPCTFSRRGQTAADPTKPWRGPTSVVGVGGPVVYAGVKAVVALEEYSDQKGSSISRPAKMMVLVAENSFPTGHIDVKTLDLVDDGQTIWKICKLLPVMPGSVPLIYFSELEG